MMNHRGTWERVEHQPTPYISTSDKKKVQILEAMDHWQATSSWKLTGTSFLDKKPLTNRCNDWKNEEKNYWRVCSPPAASSGTRHRLLQKVPSAAVTVQLLFPKQMLKPVQNQSLFPSFWNVENVQMVRRWDSQYDRLAVLQILSRQDGTLTSVVALFLRWLADWRCDFLPMNDL